MSNFDRPIVCGVFIVGNTGVGKTTLIQSLLDYAHSKEKDSSGNITL
jgi:nucleoside-triphosphatase THEP1